ncbi:MAG: hypothetical protein JSS66_04835 [Armatimonadetes bacterium]|nr:hypothetical protein [Armatimonadota bacterium]
MPHGDLGNTQPVTGPEYAFGHVHPVQEGLGGEAVPNGLVDSSGVVDGAALQMSVSHGEHGTINNSFSQTVLAAHLESVRLGGGVQSPSGFLGAVGAIANTTHVDVTINQMSKAGGILPASGTINGFYVLVNGLPRTIVSSTRKGSTDYYEKRTVRLTLKSPVYAGDIVEVTYIDPTGFAANPGGGTPTLGDAGDGTAGAASVDVEAMLVQGVHDTGSPSHYLSSFRLLAALNMTSAYSYSPLEMLLGLPDEPFSPEAESVELSARLLEYRLGFPYASVTLDTEAPYGQVVLNEDVASGGIKVHLFKALDNALAPIVGADYMEDIAGRAVRKAGVLGGADDESAYEVIGAGGVHAIKKRLPKSSGNYPELKGVQFCCTSSVPKAVLVDARRTPTAAWAPIYYTVANDISREFYSVNLANVVRTSEVRLRHGGNVYAATGQADLTLAAFDDMTRVTRAQVSHYSDFRDAGDFITAGADGWFDYQDGISLVDWDLVNINRVWMHKRGQASESLKFSFLVSANLVVLGTSHAYLWSEASGLATTYTFSANVQSAVVHKDVLYVGLTDGRIYRSSNGSSYELVNSSTSLPSVNALASYGGLLWAGTSRDSSDTGFVYSYDGTSFSQAKNFAGKDVSCLQSTSKYLFAGLSGDTNAAEGAVYIYDSTQWSPSRETSTDRVDALGYGADLLWAGLSGGIVHTLSFETDGTAKAWDIPPQTSDASRFYQIRGNSSSPFVWFLTDVGVQVYYATKQTYSAVEGPPVYASGVTAVYTESDASNYKNTEFLPSGLDQASVTETTINQADILTYAAALTPSVDTTYQNASWSGFLRADYTQEYTLYLEGLQGARMYLGGELVGDDWTGGELVFNNWDNPVSGELSATFDLIAGQVVPIRVETYRASGASMVKLSWSGTNVSKEVIPAESLFLNDTVDSRALLYDVMQLGDDFVFSAEDGRLYTLDTDPVTSRVRRVYARFEDEAGNVTASTLLTNDFIIEDAERRGDEIVSSGKIYQVTDDKQIVATFTPQQNGALYAPDRRLRITGRFESVPFYVAALTRWDMISFAATLDAGTEQNNGLEQGVEVRLFVRTGDTRDELLAADWGTEYKRSTIPPDDDSGYVDTALVGDFSLEPIEQKKWLQFKLELVTAQQNVSPVVHSVTLSYLEAEASYFFTTMFDTSDYSATVPAPEFRRGILTANSLPNGGIIKYGYTTSEEAGDTFDFAQYTEITPNQVFKLPTTSDKIRFGIMIVSISSVDPAVVDEFGTILDAGAEDMNFM